MMMMVVMMMPLHCKTIVDHFFSSIFRLYLYLYLCICVSSPPSNFTILTKFHNYDKISLWWPNFTIFTKFHNFHQILNHCTIALLHYCTIALLHYCTIALLHYCTIVNFGRHFCTWGRFAPKASNHLLYRMVVIFALLHHCTIALLHYCTNALLHYCTIALLHYFELWSSFLHVRAFRTIGF